MQRLATSTGVRPRPGPTVGIALAFAAMFAVGRAAAFEWRVDITPAGELFPALELSQARPASARSTGSGNGLVNVRVSGSGLPRSLRLRVDTPGLTEPAIVEASPRDATTIDLRPRLDWNVAELRGLVLPRRQILRITLEGDGIAAETRSVGVRLHPLDDALYFVREGRDRVDLGWAFAGYVNPRDAVVDEVLALARDIEPDFDAVTANDAADRLRRVGAVWAALERRGLRYAGDDPALSRGPSVYSQRVRLLGDVWRERRANCLDGSVLIASVLERLGIPAMIALVPGHAFVGFQAYAEAGAKRGEPIYLETTLLGATVQPTNAALDFAAARRAGHARWRAAAAKLDGRHGPDYALIDIDRARAYGIIPLPVHADIVLRRADETGSVVAHRAHAGAND